MRRREQDVIPGVDEASASAAEQAREEHQELDTRDTVARGVQA